METANAGDTQAAERDLAHVNRKRRLRGDGPLETLKPGKSKLAQERSRATQLKIVKSALQLWNRRGFDEGFDNTTVDQIADNAEVSRATVYYYFPKKEDILREVAWVTAEDVYETALRSMMSGQSVDEVVDQVMDQLGNKVSRSSRSAVGRMLQLRNADQEAISRDASSGGLTRAFAVVIAHAQEVGDLPREASAIEVAEVLTSVAMGCIGKWSIVDDVDLTPMLKRRAALVLAGARTLPKA